MTTLALPSYAQLSEADEAALTELFRRGTPPNTLRAWERDLAYIAAWKMAAFGQPLLRMTFDWKPNDIAMTQFIGTKVEAIAKAMGPKQYRMNFTKPGDTSSSSRYFQHDIVNEPLEAEGGLMAVPRHTAPRPARGGEAGIVGKETPRAQPEAPDQAGRRHLRPGSGQQPETERNQG